MKNKGKNAKIKTTSEKKCMQKQIDSLRKRNNKTKIKTGKKMPQKTIKLNGIVSNALVNIPCNINVVLVVFCLHMFVAAKQPNRRKRNCGKKEQKTRAMYANATVDRAHIHNVRSVHSARIYTTPHRTAQHITQHIYVQSSMWLLPNSQYIQLPDRTFAMECVSITISSIPSIPSNNHFLVGLRCERVARDLANVLNATAVR